MESLTGIIISVVAGLLTGTFMWPMKIIKKLQFEHYWFPGSSLACWRCRG